MTTQTHPTSRLQRTPEPTKEATKRRPAGRTIVPSIVSGAVAALVLALVGFAGGTETTDGGDVVVGVGLERAPPRRHTLRDEGRHDPGADRRRADR